jgi:hypothetical protein
MAAKSITDPVTARHAAIPPIAKALLAQALAWIVVQATFGEPAPVALLIESLLAGGIGRLFGLERWWFPLNAGFTLLVAAGLMLAIDPLWYLAAFAILFVTYWSTFRTQVPLFLSNREAVDALATLLPTERPVRLLDIGCGTGTVMAGLAGRMQGDRLRGVEIAPVPFAIAWLRGRLSRGAFSVTRDDFWCENLADEDVVYAFLSPVPMGALWRKVRAEMRPGSLFVSNTFEVPGVAPDHVIPLGRSGRALLVWRL